MVGDPKATSIRPSTRFWSMPASFPEWVPPAGETTAVGWPLAPPPTLPKPTPMGTEFPMASKMPTKTAGWTAMASLFPPMPRLPSTRLIVPTPGTGPMNGSTLGRHGQKPAPKNGTQTMMDWATVRKTPIEMASLIPGKPTPENGTRMGTALRTSGKMSTNSTHGMMAVWPPSKTSPACPASPPTPTAEPAILTEMVAPTFRNRLLAPTPWSLILS